MARQDVDALAVPSSPPPPESPNRDGLDDGMFEFESDRAISPDIAQLGDTETPGEEAAGQLLPLREVSAESEASLSPPGSTISRLLKGKDREWEAATHRPGPLTLLELPADILRLIVKEVMCTPPGWPYVAVC